MFYFLLNSFMTYNFILIAAAVIPAVFLMVRVWRADRLEKESPTLMMQLVKGGILSALLALVEERVCCWILDAAVPKDTVLYNVLLYFAIVAVAEESSKYIFLKRNSWNSPEFNSQYDGVVYAVFTSLGFALWENISYHSRPRMLRRVQGRVLRFCKKISELRKACRLKGLPGPLPALPGFAARRLRFHCLHPAGCRGLVFYRLCRSAVHRFLYSCRKAVKKGQSHHLIPGETPRVNAAGSPRGKRGRNHGTFSIWESGGKSRFDPACRRA